MLSVSESKIGLGWRKFKFRLLPLFAVLVLWQVAAWPAVMTGDSFDSWNQLQTDKYNDWHPISYTLYLKALSFNGISPSFVTIFQLLLMAYCFYRLFIFLSDFFIPERAITAATIMMILPFFGNMAVTIWKDVPYTLFSLLGMIIIIENYKNKFQKMLPGVFLLGIGSTFRHEGFYQLILVLSLLVFIFFMRSILKKATFSLQRTLTIGLLVLLINFCLVSTTISLTDASKIPKWIGALSFISDLAYVSANDSSLLPPKTERIINEISKGDSLAAAKACDSSAGMVFSEGWSAESAEKYSDSFFKLWFDAIKTDAAPLIVYAHLCRGAAFYPPPFSFGLRGNTWGWTSWGSHPANWPSWHLGADGKRPNLENITSETPVPSIEFVMSHWRSLWFESGRFYAWPGLHLLLSLILLSYLIRKKITNYRVVPVFLSVVCQHLILVVFGGGPDYRYAFSTHVVSIALIYTLIRMGFQSQYRNPRNNSKNLKNE
jgi:hypothetical protein